MNHLLQQIDSRRIAENLKNRMLDGSVLILFAAGLVLLAATAGH